jgi:hypothetical protein
MEQVRRAATIVAGLVLIYLGILNIAYRDSLLTWQPMPGDAPWKVPFACLSGLILIVSGIGVLLRRWRSKSAMLGAVWIGLWALLLHLPHVAMARDVGALLGLSEAAANAIGLATLAGYFDTRERGTALRLIYGLCLVIFGTSHFWTAPLW